MATSKMQRRKPGEHPVSHGTDKLSLNLVLLGVNRISMDYRKVLGLQAREALKRQAWERSLSTETSSEFYANIFVADELAKEWLMTGTEFEDNTNVRFTFS